MIKKILIDAAHSEETRVVLLKDGNVENFDRESLSVKQLKGNIYLAKVTAIESSLQAAFLDYGGDRHGFLPFSDIHPDYYNIPEGKLKDLKAIEHLKSSKVKNTARKESKNSESFEEELDDDLGVDEDVIDTSNKQSARLKIQDVIKEGQYVLVQVLKEERGNKGVAMTTYISLAGRYIVLMANSPGKGGVSKKISNLRDRKILKNILRNLQVPQDKSVIVRTAGVGKKPEEILKDYIYLAGLWKGIQQIVVGCKTPTFIHAEDDVIKRCMRDLGDDVKEIIVEGAEAYKTIKGILKVLPTDIQVNVKPYKERVPIFHKYNVEKQIMNLYNNKIVLPSGASIVIDQTEALVAIDVNSGKATKESSVEEMAVAINIEAAKEIARQLKLRDLAGLVVIDFIDMFDLKNRRTVERAMRDALSNDRARIQTSKLSMFCLMELSRQRLRGSLIARVSEPCPCCEGSGVVKSKEIIAMSIIRAIRHGANDRNTGVIYVFTSPRIALYMLNYKREEIKRMEGKYKVHIFLKGESDMENDYHIKRRKNLTDEEKKRLYPKAVTGKANLMFDDESLYGQETEKDYSFDSGCYFREKPDRKPRKKYPKDNRRRRDFHRSEKHGKEGWLKSIFKKKKR